MERKLELKYIAGYLPYGLKAEVDANSALGICTTISFDGKEIKRDERRVLTIGVDFEGKQYADVGYCSAVPVCKIKPILRPLSDLYKKITHNGKEIVPIVELAKITYNDSGWHLQNKKDWFYAELDNSYDILKFWYIKENNSFSSNSFAIINQYKLFDYLNELKIDYRCLIDAGLAIDCNTLDINPYK